MEFVQGFLWGSGLSLGMCVGLVVWLFLRSAAHRALGLNSLHELDTVNRESLVALKRRNEISSAQTVVFREIAEQLAELAEKNSS